MNVQDNTEALARELGNESLGRISQSELWDWLKNKNIVVDVSLEPKDRTFVMKQYWDLENEYSQMGRTKFFTEYHGAMETGLWDALTCLKIYG